MEELERALESALTAGAGTLESVTAGKQVLARAQQSCAEEDLETQLARFHPSKRAPLLNEYDGAVEALAFAAKVGFASASPLVASLIDRIVAWASKLASERLPAAALEAMFAIGGLAMPSNDDVQRLRARLPDAHRVQARTALEKVRRKPIRQLRQLRELEALLTAARERHLPNSE